MRKKILSLALALSVCLGLAAPATAASSDFVIEGDVLLYYTGSGGNVTIPSGVTSINDNAFNSCAEVTGVSIPSSVTSIGFNAFAFSGLTSVTIPSSVTSIGDNAFSSCTSLTSVSIPSSITSIGLAVFYECRSLRSVTIPSSVTSIGADAFAECESLTSVTIPSSVISIGTGAFADCTNLASVTMLSSIASISEGMFLDCDSLTKVTIPSSVTSIGASAFAECDKLASVTIPLSVTHIESDAFGNCVSLTDIYYSGGEEQWKAAYKGEEKDYNNATIHYKSGGSTRPSDPPTQPEQPAKKLAKAADQNITIDGKAVAFQTYVLSGTNYVKLRDIAHVLNGTGASFSVDYDNQKKSISLSTGKAYQDTGAEMSTPFAGANKEYNRKNLTIIVNGSPVELDALSMKDDSGNGYTYFKLRDLGSALGFNVGYNGGVYLETDKPYVG